MKIVWATQLNASKDHEDSAFAPGSQQGRNIGALPISCSGLHGDPAIRAATGTDQDARTAFLETVSLSTSRVAITNRRLTDRPLISIPAMPSTGPSRRQTCGRRTSP